MIRRDDSVLNTQRQNVVASRKRKLRELYCATVAYHDLSSSTISKSDRDQHHQSSTHLTIHDFLDLNDITKGRRFNIDNVSLIFAKPATKPKSSNDISTPLQFQNNVKPTGNDSEGNGTVQKQQTSSSPKKSREDGLKNGTFQESRAFPEPESVIDANVPSTKATDLPIATSDPTSQLLLEAARGAALEENASTSTAGVKRSHESSNDRPPEDSPSKRRKDDIRQPMRIDTNVHNQRPSLAGPIESPAPLTTATPERMTTRVSSGALRHKSVSEILGATPRTAHPDASESKDASNQTPRTAASPNASLFGSRLNETNKDKDRTKLSTVVFPKQPVAAPKPSDAKSDELRKREKIWEQKDYLVPLFYAQASAQNPKLNQLVISSKKTLTSNDHRLEYREDQDCRILKRIYHLQNSNRWSLRQLDRAKEPDRPMTHWDALLGEAKWLRTDFREERRWKIAAAKNLADWCAEYVNNAEDERNELRVKLKKAGRPSSANNLTTPMSLPNGSGIPPSDPTPDLIPSTADDVSEFADEDLAFDITQTIAPAALFSLPPSDILFSVKHTPASDKMLEELPMYQIWSDSSADSQPLSVILDSYWKTPIAPVTKYATGKMTLQQVAPLRRKSRFDHAEEDEVEQDSLSLDNFKVTLSPEKTDVALFDPENRHIVARLHAAHAFRPPSEFPMPAQGFFEARQPSQWTVNEDDQLRRLVREYEYNWSLISACMVTRSMFNSGSERRTPWECFERWVSFEGLPGDMAKHQYFRAWNSRREAAKEHLEQLYQAQLQNPATSHLPPRRRSAEPITVERRKQGKYLSLFTIMSKAIKKREIALAKQQAAAATPTKKPTTESVDQRQAKMRTPREFSLHKHKQECEFREKRLLYQQQMMVQQRAAAMAKAAQASGQPIPPQARQGMPMQSNGVGNHLVVPNGNRPQPNAAAANGMANTNGQMNMRTGGVQLSPQQQAQYVAMMQQQQQQQQHPRVPSQNDPNRIMMEAGRMAEMQRSVAQQRQYQQSNGLNGAPNMAFANNAAMLANMQTANGRTSPAGPAANGVGTMPRTSSSPMAANAVPVQSNPMGAMVPLLNQVTAHLKAQHPTATSEQIMQMATIALNKQLQRHNTAAVNGNVAAAAAAGVPGQMALGQNGQINSQMYAQIMRNQQLQQASQQNRANSAGRSGSPNDASRPGSQGGAMMQKQNSAMGSTVPSPRPPSAQMAGSS